jgi:fucose 4-O-acetylase-like acetyltransferase
VLVLALPDPDRHGGDLVNDRIGSVDGKEAAMRDDRIDTYRGLACVLLVLFHTVGGPDNGLRLADDSFWRIVTADSLVYFRMPLFCFLSGLIYGLRPLRGDPVGFLLGKARRLLVPMLVVGTILAVMRSLVLGQDYIHDWTVYPHVAPVGQFWFSEGLFLIFVLIAVLETLGVLRSRMGLVSTLGVAVVAQLNLVPPPQFGMWGANYLFPFFLCGLACSRFGLAHRSLFRDHAALTVFWFGFALAGILGYAPFTDRVSLVALVLGASFCLTLTTSGWSWAPLASIGRSSYAIFLFHVFLTSGVRILGHRAGVDDPLIVVPAATAAGLLVPIGLESLMLRSRVSALLFLGRSVESRSVEAGDVCRAGGRPAGGE